jgi:hypothetical protein
MDSQYDIEMFTNNSNNLKRKNKKRSYKELKKDIVYDNINEFLEEQFCYSQKAMKRKFSDDNSIISETSCNTQLEKQNTDFNIHYNEIDMQLEKELVKRFYEKHNKELMKAMFG